ncbi:MAG: cupin domain-containing protein [Polyangiaceae bacterium]
MSDRLESMLQQLARRLDETNAKMDAVSNGNGKSNGNGSAAASNGSAAAAPNGGTATTRLEAMVAQLARRLEETNTRLDQMQKQAEETKSALVTPFDGLTICDGSKVKWFHAFENLERKVHAFNDKLMLTEHHMAKGSVFPRHSHPHEQLAYLVSGHIKVCCGDYTFEGRAGDSFVVRGGIEHQVWAIEESVALDIFTPVREDYLEFKS